MRFDAEHYQMKYDVVNKLISQHKFAPLRDLISRPIVTGHTPSMTNESFYGGEIPFIKTDNLRENKITESFSHFLSEKGSAELANSKLEKDDIIVTIIGATFDIVGRSAIVRKSILPANINQNIALIRADKQKISSEYLNIYLNTKYGKSSLHHHSRQTEQVNLNCREVERVLVPIFKTLSSEIENLATCLNENFEQAKRLYTQAEALLLKSLGLENFSPSSKNTNIKSFKDSFQTTDRLDAEYYQPKYEEIISHIKAQPHAKLSELVAIKKSIEPGSDEYSDDEEGLPFLRVADYNKFGTTEPQKKLKTSFVAENQDKLDALMPKSETILFSKDGSVGEAYCLREDSNFITSGAVLHLAVRDKKKVLPDYLTLALNSKLVRMQAERDSGGSIILHWRVGEIEEVLIPVIDQKTQSKISSLIQESFTLKAKSEKLLEVAKKAVEMAIEESEEKAIKFIEKLDF